MGQPIRHGDEWWAQATDGSWRRWDPAEYRWEPQPGMPPFPYDPAAVADPSAEPGESASAVASPRPAPPAPSALPQSLRDFEPADRLGRLASVLVGVAAASAAASVPLLIARAASSTAVFEENTFLSSVSALSGLALLTAAIATVVWLKDAYENASALGATHLRYTPGWTIGAWFIPVGNLFIPKQIVDDLWRTSDAGLPPDVGAQWKFRPVPTILHIWWSAWVAYIVGSLGANLISQQAVEEGDASGLRTALWLEAAAYILLAIAGMLLIRIISNVTARQRERARMLESQTNAIDASEAGPSGEGSLPQ